MIKPALTARQLKYWIKLEFHGQKRVVTTGRGNALKQAEFFLTGTENELQIRNLVAKGLDLSHFEGTPEGMLELERLSGVQKLNGQARRAKLQRTTLVVAPGYTAPVQVAAPPVVNSTENWALNIVAKAANITVPELVQLRGLSVEDLEKREDWKKIGRAFGLSGNFTVSKVHERIQG